MRVTTTVNGTEHEVDDVWAGESLLYLLRARGGPPLPAARGDRPARREERRRAGRVRLVHRVPGRRAGLRLSGRGRPGRGSRRRHRRGSRRRRAAASRAGGLRRARRRAVRLLHAGVDRRRARPARARALAVGSGDPRGVGGKPVSLHRLREDPRCGPAGRGPAGAAVSAGAGAGTGPTTPTTTTTTTTSGRIGDSPLRPDGTLKVTGEFAYASDLWHDDMVWGSTLRSPPPHARIRSIDIGEALKTAGVTAILTADDIPGHN